MNEDKCRNDEANTSQDVTTPASTPDDGALSLQDLDAVAGGAKRKVGGATPAAPAPIM